MFKRQKFDSFKQVFLTLIINLLLRRLLNRVGLLDVERSERHRNILVVEGKFHQEGSPDALCFGSPSLNLVFAHLA